MKKISAAAARRFKLELMPGDSRASNPVFDAEPAALPTDMLLRLYLWHKAETPSERLRFLPYSRESILESPHLAADLQTAERAVNLELNRRLEQLLNGVDARTAFKQTAADKRRTQVLAMEALRLIQIRNIAPARAKELVAKDFSVTTRVVEDALKRWRKNARFSAHHVNSYAETLRIHSVAD